jgi:uncharacterized damage-inducible protein DinB
MSKTQFIRLAAFNVWANRTMTDFISSNFSSGQEENEITSSFPSVRKTIYHVWDAEKVWLERMKGNSLMEFPSVHYQGSFSEGRQLFLQNSIALHEFISEKPQDFFEGDISYVHTSGKPYTQEASDVLTHVMNHSTFHRGQLITMFRQLGFNKGIPKTDFIEYVRQKVGSKQRQ